MRLSYTEDRLEFATIVMRVRGRRFILLEHVKGYASLIEPEALALISVICLRAVELNWVWFILLSWIRIVGYLPAMRFVHTTQFNISR